MDIRFCTKVDIGYLMDFLEEHWSVSHVLARSHAMMEWQHSGTFYRDYDFVAAFDGNEVLGCLGFILSSRFDPELAAADTIWMTNWKVRDGGPSGLGMQLYTFLLKNVQHRSIGTVGNNLEVAIIYRALGYETGVMSQHYVLHPKLSGFDLACVPEGSLRIGDKIDRGAKPTLRKVDSDGIRELEGKLDGVWPEDAVPRKSLTYFITRFIEHPFYEYKVYAIERQNMVLGLLVARLCENDGIRALRLVDVYASGDALRGIATQLQKLLQVYNAEYVDLYQTGFDDDTINSSGLLTVKGQDADVIIPNYFEPLVRKNIAINWAYKLKGEQHLIAFKADCDQDRPNQMK